MTYSNHIWIDIIKDLKQFQAINGPLSSIKIIIVKFKNKCTMLIPGTESIHCSNRDKDDRQMD